MRGSSIFAAPPVTVAACFPPADLGRCEEEVDVIQRVLEQRLALLRPAVGVAHFDDDVRYELCRQLREVESSWQVVVLDLAAASPELLHANAALLAQVRRCAQHTRLVLGMMRDVWLPGCWLCLPQAYYGSSEVEKTCHTILLHAHKAIDLTHRPSS